jgi:hypothetical protein
VPSLLATGKLNIETGKRSPSQTIIGDASANDVPKRSTLRVSGPSLKRGESQRRAD